MKSNQVALIVGVGPGLGFALARRCARAEMHVALAARRVERLETMAAECSGVHHHGRAYGCDATREDEVRELFRAVEQDLGVPDLVIYNVGVFARKSVLDTTPEEFRRGWEVGCLGGFLVGQAAARRMLARPSPAGTILFTGATASLRGGAQFQNFAVGKFGLRALAQSMARELHPRGIHVAHVVIDGAIRPRGSVQHTGEQVADDMLDADAIAENYLRLHCQPRSAWTQELDLRSWVEKF